MLVETSTSWPSTSAGLARAAWTFSMTTATASHLDAGLGPRAGVFEGVADEVLEHQPQEIADPPIDAPPGGLGLEDRQHLPHQACQIHPVRLSSARPIRENARRSSMSAPICFADPETMVR
jgi:hypothetical protein